MQTNHNTCPLCKTSSSVFFEESSRVFYDCPLCRGIWLDQRHYLTAAEEKNRYLQHNNDVEDLGYQKFVMPIVEAVKSNYETHKTGLDFGAGTGPVIAKLLEEDGYEVSLYDPFFHQRPEMLKKQYDFIVCCETMEHFHHPNQEFTTLYNLLNPGGGLLCMTHLYDESIPFANWYYKNDPTHVFIYRKNTIDWIASHFGFSHASIKGRLIFLKK